MTLSAPKSKSKKILLVQYSQTGQLFDVARSFVRPLIESDAVQVDTLNVEPLEPFPFPWRFLDFLDQFPETVYLDTPALRPIDWPADIDYDLIILAYQVWFLAPSPPIAAFMKDKHAATLLAGRPVITLIACRNMWAMAQKTMVGSIEALGARLLDNVVLIDQSSSLASFVTTPRWMFTGRKNSFWGLPPAGIAPRDIENCDRFGRAIERALRDDLEKESQPLLTGLKAVQADYGLIQSETIGYRSFRIWGKLLRKIGGRGSALRRKVLLLYFVFLILMIITVVPISIALKSILSIVYRDKYLQRKVEYEKPSGSGDERMEEFSEIE